MINKYTQLTSKYLKANKKRTMLTIIGIVLSVALISTIGLFLKGMQDVEMDNIKQRYGSFHLAYRGFDESLITKVSSNPKVLNFGLVEMKENQKIGKRLSIDMVTATDKGLELLPYKVKEGSFPKNETEVAVEKWALKYIDKDAKLGKKIKLNNKEFTLAGILEDNYKSQVDGKGIVLSKTQKPNLKKAMLLVEINPKTNMNAALKELKALTKKDNVIENSYLLIMTGSGDRTSQFAGLYFIVAIIIGIVAISTIAVIYNSFQISVVERIKQFGLLRAVGTTPKQIRKIVLREATILALIGIPIGLLCGIIAICGIGLAFKIIGGDLTIMKIAISPAILGISALVGLVSIYVSALIPAYFAGKISPLVAISSRSSITKEKIKRRKNRIIGKVLGFEGSMAAKNIKRNRKRYRITVFSIIISVTLFVTFKSFMDMALNVSGDINESSNLHFSVVKDSRVAVDNVYIEDKIVKNIEALDTVSKSYKVYQQQAFHAAVASKHEIKEVGKLGSLYGKTTFEGIHKTLLNTSMAVFDNASLNAAKKYIKQGSIDNEKLKNGKGVIYIAKNQLRNEKTQNMYYGPILDLKVGDEIDLQYFDKKKGKVEFGKGQVKRVKVMAVLKYDPFFFRGSDNGLKLIASEDIGKWLTGKDKFQPINLNVIIKDEKMEDQAKAEIEDAIKENPSLKVINIMNQNKNNKSGLLMIQILLYGFVIVVSLIGSVNIINTLTTNIILRKRELASLKAVGMTQRGLKKLVVLEGILYSVMGTIYGSTIGCILSFLIFKGLSGVRESGWDIPVEAIMIAGGATLMIGYISVLSPLSRINKENLIDSVREDF